MLRWRCQIWRAGGCGAAPHERGHAPVQRAQVRHSLRRQRIMRRVHHSLDAPGQRLCGDAAATLCFPVCMLLPPCQQRGPLLALLCCCCCWWCWWWCGDAAVERCRLFGSTGLWHEEGLQVSAQAGIERSRCCQRVQPGGIGREARPLLQPVAVPAHHLRMHMPVSTQCQSDRLCAVLEHLGLSRFQNQAFSAACSAAQAGHGNDACRHELRGFAHANGPHQ